MSPRQEITVDILGPQKPTTSIVEKNDYDSFRMLSRLEGACTSREQRKRVIMEESKEESSRNLQADDSS